MGGGGSNQTTTTTGSASPQVTSTTNDLLSRLTSQVGQGTAVYNNSLYPGAGQTTQNSWAGLLSASNNPAFSAGVKGATSDFADIAAGNQFGTNDPGYAALRAGLADDVTDQVNATLQGSGRFGSGSHAGTLTRELTSSLGGLDYANYQNDVARQERAAAMLPQLYSAGLMPASVVGQVGAAQDADSLAQRQAANDLFRRQNDAGWDTLARASSILNGTAGSAGTTTTQSTPQSPWWMSALGLGAALL